MNSEELNSPNPRHCYQSLPYPSTMVGMGRERLSQWLSGRPQNCHLLVSILQKWALQGAQWHRIFADGGLALGCCHGDAFRRSELLEQRLLLMCTGRERKETVNSPQETLLIYLHIFLNVLHFSGSVR